MTLPRQAHATGVPLPEALDAGLSDAADAGHSDAADRKSVV